MSNANGLEHSNRFSFLVPSIGAEPGVPTLARLRRAPTMPLGRILLGDLLGLETKALRLLVAIVIADRAVDAGALRRHAYLLAALAGCVVGELFTTPFGWAWDDVRASSRNSCSTRWRRSSGSTSSMRGSPRGFWMAARYEFAFHRT